MSVQAHAWAKTVKTGSPTLKAVLVAVADYADAAGRAWPSQEQLAADTEFSVRAVRNAILGLEGLGLLEREERRRKDGSRSTDILTLRIGQSANRHDVPPVSDQPAPRSKQPAPHDSQPAPRAGLTTFEPSLNHQGIRQASADPAASEPAESAEQRDKQARQDRRDLVEQAVSNLCAITGRSRASARAAIGSWLSMADEELHVVAGLIDEADRREVVDPSNWITAQLRARRDQGRDPPPGARQPSPRQPTGNVARSLELKRLLQEREHGNRETDDRPGHDQPGATRGDDHGVAWASGGGGRPAEPVLRAARQGAFDPRAAAALRRVRAPRGAA